MISPWSTNPKTTEGKKFVFRACFIDDFQGQVMAKFARENLKAQTAAVLYDVASEYNKGIAEFFKKFFEAAGGKVVAFRPIPRTTRISPPSSPLSRRPTPGCSFCLIITTKSPAGAAGPAVGHHLPRYRLRLLGQRRTPALGRARLGGLLFQHPLCARHRHPHGQKIHGCEARGSSKKPDDVARPHL